MTENASLPRTRGHKKKERTRSQLMAAGLRVLARKGEGLSISDVVAEAEVSNGTFYNYFADRDALLEAVAVHTTHALSAVVAHSGIEDPARRFAIATMGILRHAQSDRIWARVTLGLVSRPGSGLDVSRYLQEDLAEGFGSGRFAFGPDDVTLDQVVGLVVMTIRRIADGAAATDAPAAAVERGLHALGVEAAEARRLALDAMAWHEMGGEGTC